jgi:LemA protein
MATPRVLGAAAAIAYNSLVCRRNRTAEAWSQIDVQLKRQHDLIPNLVAVVPAMRPTNAPRSKR